MARKIKRENETQAVEEQPERIPVSEEKPLKPEEASPVEKKPIKKVIKEETLPFKVHITRPAAAAVRLINGTAIITANRRVSIIKVDSTKGLDVVVTQGV